MPIRRELRERRSRLLRAWDRYFGTDRTQRGDGHEDEQAPSGLRTEIVASWERSADHLPSNVDAAPMADPDETRTTWEESPLRSAVERLEPDLRLAADDGDLVVALTDPWARILWTYGGRVMRRHAERVNFVPGGRWDEASVGTNALDLALRVDGPATVYSAEHFSSAVHEWVCWAAPVHDPVTGRQLGVLDLSTTWDRTHPIGLATAGALARLLERELPGIPAQTAARAGPGAVAGQPMPAGPLRLCLLGRAEAWLGGARLLLTRRQTEILALLVLNPRGFSLDELHALIYGDGTVSRTTLKAEVSHLRSALGGRIASRPYRLDMPVHCDVVDVLDHIRAGDVAAAAAAYGGDLMPGSDSPALAEYGHYVAVALREALLANPQPEAVLRFAESVPYDVEVLERALAALGTAPSATRPLLTARLRAAQSG
jgi:hypothetical protein